MEYMLSNKDIGKVVGEHIPITPSSEFHRIRNIDDLLSPSGKGIILYEDSRNGRSYVGHWCALCRFAPGKLAFYDPYGGFPDSQLRHIPMCYRRATNQVLHHMKRLLHDSKYKELHYNPYRHQRMADGIHTCGRHVALYLKAACDPEIYHQVMQGLRKASGRGGRYMDVLAVDMTTNIK